MRAVSGAVKARGKTQSSGTVIVIEPGIGCSACRNYSLYSWSSKGYSEIRSYVSIDGGMTDNPRYALYKSSYTALIANKADQPPDCKFTIAGRCCESGDLIQENTMLQSCQHGDIMAVLATGAYNYSMSSNYNRLPRPAVVMVKDGESRIVVKAEDYEDIVRNDI